MTRDEATALLNCSLAELAEKLKTTTAALAQWDENNIPSLREYQIRDLAAGRTPIGLEKRKQNLNDVLKQSNV